MKSLFGGIMMGCGILIAGLFGLCTLLVTGSSLVGSSYQSSAEMLSVIPAALIFGGLPCLGGIALFFAGRHVLRSAARDRRDLPPDQSDVFK